jgi:hypothetical protein
LALVRDFIKAFKPDDWFPSFHAGYRIPPMGISQ